MSAGECVKWILIQLKFNLQICIIATAAIIELRTVVVLTRKKSQVLPWYSVPYCTSVCEAKSSGELMGVTIRSTVKNAAKLAVYDEIRIRVKNHQTEPTMRPDNERGDMSQPCCMKAPSANQNEFNRLNSFTVVACVAAIA